MRTCSFIGTKPSSQSAIGGTSSLQQLLREQVAIISSRRLERRLELAEEHRAVELEVVVVAAVERVEVERPLALEELAVGRDRLLVPDDDVVVVAAEHVDVGRHVQQVAGIGHEVAQLVAGAQRAFRVRRHLHEVDVHVQQAGMALASGRLDLAHGPLQHVAIASACRRLRPAGRSGGPTAATACGS